MSRRSSLCFAGMPAAFWAALVVLVLNDHALKGSGLLPALLTGKLSDFAGLIVAPLLLCAALSVRTDRGRGVALGAVALGLAVIKLSPSCADGAGRLLTALGMPSRIWCDPTDLIAFAILPWAAQLARDIEPMPARRSRLATIGVASLACVATTCDSPEPLELSGPFLINWTQGEIDARVVLRSIACDRVGEDAATVSELELRYQLAPAQLVELGALVEGDAGITGCGEADVMVGDAMARVSWGLDASDPITREVSYSDKVITDAGYDVSAIVHNDAWAFERAITVSGSAVSPKLEIGTLLHRESAP